MSIFEKNIYYNCPNCREKNKQLLLLLHVIRKTTSGEKKGSACEEKCETEPNPKPRPKPKPSSADVAKRRSLDRLALIGKPVCGRGACVGGGGLAVYYVRIHKSK